MIRVIEHVKWNRQSSDPEFYPAADTDQFGMLVKMSRGTLIHVEGGPSGPTRDQFSVPSSLKMFPQYDLAVHAIKQILKTFNIEDRVKIVSDVRLSLCFKENGNPDE